VLNEINVVKSVGVEQIPSPHAVHYQMVADGSTTASQPDLDDLLVLKVLWGKNVGNSLKIERTQWD
jgi:hypothetical protein